MISIGLVLIVVGILVIVLAAFIPRAAPASTVGWAVFVLGVVLLLIGLILPALPVAHAALLPLLPTP
jgi:membrane-bound ClpP family serine protease